MNFENVTENLMHLLLLLPPLQSHSDPNQAAFSLHQSKMVFLDLNKSKFVLQIFHDRKGKLQVLKQKSTEIFHIFTVLKLLLVSINANVQITDLSFMKL